MIISFETKVVIEIAFIIIDIIFTCMIVRQRYLNMVYNGKLNTTHGTIYKWNCTGDNDGKSCIPYVEYSAYGIKYRRKNPISCSQQIKKKVTVLYYERNPKIFYIEALGVPKDITIIFITLLVISVISNIILALAIF